MSESEPSRPTAVIAGGTGFIGRRLAAELGGNGWQVVVLTRKPAPAAVGPVSFQRWPEGDGWTEALENATALINLCGETIGGPRWTSNRKTLLVESRTGPTRLLVDAVNAAANPPAVFIQASGVGYYGTGDRERSEADEPGEDFLADLAQSWEAPLAELRDDVRPVIARFGVVLGKTGGALGQMLLPFRLFVGGPLASGHQWLSWIHLNDAIAALRWLMDHEECRGAYNVTAPHPVRNETFAAVAGKALRRPSVMFTPRFVLKLLLGEQATLLCDGQNAPPDRLSAAGFQFGFPTIDMALADLV
jgi:uncharacterized protein (TIGR01777 family)